MMKIFCCFGKSAAVASDVEPSPDSRAFSDALTSASSQLNRAAQHNAPRQDIQQQNNQQEENIFALASQQYSIDSVSWTDTIIVDDVMSFSFRFPINQSGEGIKYEYTGTTSSEPDTIHVKEKMTHHFSMMDYSENQSKFNSDTNVAIKDTSQKLIDKKLGHVDELLKHLGQQRAELAPAGDNNNFGVIRETYSSTRLIGVLYSAPGKALEASLERRLASNDAHVKANDLSDLDDDEFKQIKEHFLDGRQYYRETVPSFENKEGKNIDLSKVVRCGGANIVMYEGVKYQFINPFDFIIDGKQDLSAAGPDFTAAINGCERENHEKDLVTLYHPSPAELQPLTEEMDRQFTDFKEAFDIGDKEQMLDSGSNLVFLLANAVPFERGSAWASEVLASSVMQLVTGDNTINFSGTNLDFVAFGSSADEFKQSLKNFVDERPAHTQSNE